MIPQRVDPVPRGGHDLLLRAALLPGAAAREAFAAWRAGVDLDRLDQASYRLVPLAVTNLETAGVDDDPWFDRLRGMRRRLWLETQMLLRRVEGPLARLAAADVDVLVLKGAALLGQAYGGGHVRSMADVDLAVRLADLDRALGAVAPDDWRPVGRAARAHARSATAFLTRHGAVGLAQPRDEFAVLDLHVRILSIFQFHTVPFPEDALFAAAEPFTLRGQAVLRPAPHHQLLHITFHGMQAQYVPSVRWVADAHHLIRQTAARLDWEALFADCVRHRLLGPVREALDLLAARYGTPVPAEVRERFGAARLARVERLERPLRLGAAGAAADYRSCAARVLRLGGADVGPAERARVAWNQLQRALFRLPVKHALRPGLRRLRGAG